MPRVLVTAWTFQGEHEGKRRLAEAGFDVVDSPKPAPLTEEELLAGLRDFDAIVAGNDPLTARVLEGLPRLRAIARWGVGVDAVDLDAATRLGIIVTNTPGLIVDTVADLAFALMLAVARRIVEADRWVRTGQWREFQTTLVWGKTLGLVGVGAIGTAVARRARGFSMTVLGYDPVPRPEAEEVGVRYVPLDELLQTADFVSLHAPLTPQTRGLINARALALMKPTAILINTSRGGLVDQAALYEALRDGRIAGAGLDVFAKEPPDPDDPLLRLNNCVFTPHCGNNARETIEQVNLRVAENLIESFSGACPTFCVNPEVFQGRQ
jgi:D-3-phosphoglycerate dehydrogenase